MAERPMAERPEARPVARPLPAPLSPQDFAAAEAARDFADMLADARRILARHGDLSPAWLRLWGYREDQLDTHYDDVIDALYPPHKLPTGPAPLEYRNGRLDAAYPLRNAANEDSADV